MLLADLVFGALFGSVFALGKQLIDNGFKFNEIDRDKVANSVIVGGALGLCTALGIGFLGHVLAGTVTGLSAVISAACGLAAAAVASFTGGAVGYAVEKFINGEEVYKSEFYNQGMITMEPEFTTLLLEDSWDHKERLERKASCLV